MKKRPFPHLRRLACGLAFLLFAADAPATEELGPHAAITGLFSDQAKTRRETAASLRATNDASLVPALVDALFFIHRSNRRTVYDVLEELADARPKQSYYDWVEYVGAHPELEPAAGYLVWKRSLLMNIDKRYKTVLYDNAPTRIRLEEIVFGGVPLDGIPSIDNPMMVPAAEATYLKDREKVFGINLHGEARAYPLRFLSWHEMLNDTVGGEPVTLSYCTLCGSGILYDTRTASGGAYTFGTSGLLYRSNKLMFDRQTYSLWNNLTGEPVVGRLARSDTRLEVLPMTLTTWEAWLERHPQTTVMAFDRQLAGPDIQFDYRPGAADRARAGVAFPVWQKSDALKREEEVYALRLGPHAKAYPIDRVLAEGVINDQLGDTALVLIGDKKGEAVRAYHRGAHVFRAGGDPATIVDEAGRAWRLEESMLIPAEEGTDTEGLERLPGHVAFWFGWYGFYPETEVYGTP